MNFLKRVIKNISTLYNNLEFFLANNLIIEINLDGVKYYDLGLDNPFHEHDSHLHMVIKDADDYNPTIKEIDYPEIYDAIKSHPVFKHYNIEYIRILVSASPAKRNLNKTLISSLCDMRVFYACFSAILNLADLLLEFSNCSVSVGKIGFLLIIF